MTPPARRQRARVGGTEVLEPEGLDHSLQVPGDPAASLDVPRTVTERMREFLAELG